MKRLTINQVARSIILMNKKAYTSLFLGILTAVFLATATSLCAWGTIWGHEEQMARRVGWMDMVIMGEYAAPDEQIRATGYFRDIGHVMVDAQVADTVICTGWYDETAERLMNRWMTEGRMPEKAGEIAAERSALIRLRLEDAQVGDTLTLEMEPIHGIREEKSFTLVGILNEQTVNLDTDNTEAGMSFPWMLVSPEEKYDTGRPVVHRVVTYAPLITMNQVERHIRGRLGYAQIYGISRETGTITWNDSGWDRARYMVDRIKVWLVLGAALLLSACIGITSAMESLLSRKTEDIGMLRAIGATRQQIRWIYSSEAWLLAATALPAGMLAGVLTAWIISRAVPDQVAFSLNFWLLIPVLFLSAFCVFAASRMPLYHASRQMPMGVLRDTGLLRRAGKLRNHKMFRPGRLIAGRRTRLHPLRQAGAACMVALTLISTLLLGEVALGLNDREAKGHPAFELTGAIGVNGNEAFTQEIRPDTMSRSDIRRLAEIPGVDRINSVTGFRLNMLMEKVPEYFRPRHYRNEYPNGAFSFVSLSSLDGFGGNTDWLFYTPEDLADAAARRDEDYTAEFAVLATLQRNLLRSVTGIEENIVPVYAYAADLDPEALQEFVTDGSIDMEKLDSGEQVLVFAPTVCGKKENEEGAYSTNWWLLPREIREEDWDVIIRNDVFTAGMPLKLMEFAGDPLPDGTYYGGSTLDWKAYYQSMEQIPADVTIGAVLGGSARVSTYPLGSFTIIFSSGGAEALGLKLPNPESINVYVKGNPSLARESDIQTRISQITMMRGMECENLLKVNREYLNKKYSQMALFGALILLFSAVSVFMQVSGAARQIRSETRTIGTLRAVGADLKTLVSCYRLQVWLCAGAALIPSLLIYAVSNVQALRIFTNYHPQIVIPVLAALAACMALICIAGIRGRLAAATRQSIVDNIREL